MRGVNRIQRRREARRLYERFSRMWRDELRAHGLYGQKVRYKRPTFAQWFQMHERNTRMMDQSTPQDVVEYLGVDFSDGDPWAAQLDPRISGGDTEPANNPREDGAGVESAPERGVATIQIVGDEEA